jgi:protein SCO1
MRVTFAHLTRALALFAVILALLSRASPAHAASGAQTPWGANYFPNVPLVTQDNKKVHFFDLIKGKVVAINFIFTGCSASCSMETARLRQVQELLGDRVGKDVFFYSISIDPDNDTPEVLKAYAAKFNVAPGWTFLTGRSQDIDLLRQKLGLWMPPAKDGNPSNDHDLSLVIGNQETGRWQKASPFENPEILATQLGSWLHNWNVAGAKQNASYTGAPTHLRKQSHGEELFRTRCASCHTLGAPTGSIAALRSVGPDLGGVTRTRSHAWLARWLKEPDAMLAEKDPIALALYNRYNKLAMPNLRLKDVDIAALISFLKDGDAPAAAAMK